LLLLLLTGLPGANYCSLLPLEYMGVLLFHAHLLMRLHALRCPNYWQSDGPTVQADAGHTLAEVRCADNAAGMPQAVAVRDQNLQMTMVVCETRPRGGCEE
jgi:hypothetical protein